MIQVILYGVYIVNPQGEETRLRGHSLITELMRTVESERDRLTRQGRGFKVMTYKETWDGMNLVKKEAWSL